MDGGQYISSVPCWIMYYVFIFTFPILLYYKGVNIKRFLQQGSLHRVFCREG